MPRNSSLFKSLTFQVYKYDDLDPAIKRKVRSISLRGEGLFCSAMADYGHTATILIAFSGEEIIGWATRFVSHKDIIYVYVRHKYRRQGLGTTLINKMTKLFPRANVYPHDTISSSFFKNKGLKIKLSNINWANYDFYS